MGITFVLVRKKKEAPLLENVLIEDYAAEGKSLARVNGKVIFVEGAVPGDVVDVQLQKNKADWENDSLNLFLDGIYGYSMCKIGETPSWNLFAEILLTARVYE